MVKVMIQAEDETIVKEGEFFFGFTAKEVDNDGVLTDSAIIGEMDSRRIPGILADASVEAIMRLREDDVLRRNAELVMLDQRTNKLVKESIVSDRDALADAIFEALKDVVENLGR